MVDGIIGLWFQNWKQSATDEFLLNLTFSDRVMQVLRACGFYVRQTFFPSNFMLIHPKWPAAGDDLAGVAGCLLACGCIVAILIQAWRRRVWQRIGLGTAWFLLALIPSLGIFYIPFFVYAPVSEHYLYLALPGAIAAAVEGIGQIFKRQPKVVWLIISTIAACFCVVSHGRSKIYLSEESVWQESIAKNPDSWLGYYNLGVQAYRAGQKPKAVMAFEQALARRNNLPEASYNLGVIAHEEQDFPRALSKLKHAIDLRPDFCTARNVYAVVFYRTKQFDRALHEWKEVVLRCPSFAEAHYNLGVLLTRRGDYPSARMHLAQAIQLEPVFQEPRFSIATHFPKQNEAKQLLKALESSTPNPGPEQTGVQQ